MTTDNRSIAPAVKAHDSISSGDGPTAHFSLAKTFPGTRSNRGSPTPGVAPAVNRDALLTGKPKNHLPVKYAMHVTGRQIPAAGFGGMGMAAHSINDGGEEIAKSAAAAPFKHAYGDPQPDAKPFPIAWGNRHRERIRTTVTLATATSTA